LNGFTAALAETAKKARNLPLSPIREEESEDGGICRSIFKKEDVL
jgi:hypothetical protein